MAYFVKLGNWIVRGNELEELVKIGLIIADRKGAESFLKSEIG